MAEHVVIGRVIGVFGLRGDIKVEIGAFPLKTGLEVELEGPSFKRKKTRVARVHQGRGHVNVRFVGVDDATSAANLRGAVIRAARADLPDLPANAFLESELVGMEVIDRNLGMLGRVAGIAHYPGSDMLVIGTKRFLVPMLKAYGVRVDRAKRSIETSLPPGFEELL